MTVVVPRLLMTTILFMQIAIVCLFLVVLSSLHRSQENNDRTSLLPVKGDKGDAAVVDYAKINGMIADEVAKIPAPAVEAPKPEAIDYNRIDQMIQGKVQQEVAKVPTVQGPQGVAGTSAPIIEQRANPSTFETEWRCAGDTLWFKLKSIPLLKDSCL